MEFFAERGISVEWHYINIEESRWKKQVEERNKRIERGEGGSDFFVDEGLLKKCETMFEVPSRDEIFVWVER